MKRNHRAEITTAAFFASDLTTSFTFSSATTADAVSSRTFRVVQLQTVPDLRNRTISLVVLSQTTLTDIVTGPNGNLFLVSIDKGSVFEIFRSRGGGRP
jgi:hypothetical protein